MVAWEQPLRKSIVTSQICPWGFATCHRYAVAPVELAALLVLIPEWWIQDIQNQNKSFKISIAEKAAVSSTGNIFWSWRSTMATGWCSSNFQTSAFSLRMGAFTYPQPPPPRRLQPAASFHSVRLLSVDATPTRPPAVFTPRNISPACERPLLLTRWMQSNSADIERVL